MRFIRLLAITVLLLACVVLGSACAGANGEQGEKGVDGVGIQSIANNTDGTITVYLTNGQSYSTSELTGPQGEQGTQGEKGDKGDQGIQGVQGVQGVPGPNMIVAMGVINQSAQIVEGYNVTSCEWTSSYYLIGLTGITYDESHYVTAVTPIWSSNEHFPVITSVEGKLIVGLIDTTGTPGKGSFSFMVLEFP